MQQVEVELLNRVCVSIVTHFYHFFLKRLRTPDQTGSLFIFSSHYRLVIIHILSYPKTMLLVTDEISTFAERLRLKTFVPVEITYSNAYRLLVIFKLCQAEIGTDRDSE